MTGRLRSLARTAAFAGGLAALCSPSVAEQFRDWTVLAREAGGCLLHQRVIAAKAGLTIADVFLAPSGGGGLVVSARVPVGAALSSGMAYRHPGRAMAVPLVWQSCDAESCLAQVEVTAEERARLMRGLRVEMAFVPVPGARPLRFQLSLLGLTAALGSAPCRAGD